MTKQEAKKILKAYRETDEDTGEKYGYIIQSYHGEYGGGFVFRCKVEGVKYKATDTLPLVSVFSDGKVGSPNVIQKRCKSNTDAQFLHKSVFCERAG